MRAKLESYTDLQAKELKKPRWYVLARLPFEYPILFFRYYVAAAELHRRTYRPAHHTRDRPGALAAAAEDCAAQREARI